MSYKGLMTTLRQIIKSKTNCSDCSKRSELRECDTGRFICKNCCSKLQRNILLFEEKLEKGETEDLPLLIFPDSSSCIDCEEHYKTGWLLI